jgi:integrase
MYSELIMLTPYRRHRAKCKSKGRRAKCSCPIWVQGMLHGEKVRRSLDLTNWEAAQKLIRDWEIHGLHSVVTLNEAYDRFIEQHEANGSAPATLVKHRRLRKHALEFFCDIPLRSLSVDDVSRFRESWNFAPMTTKNTIERMRSFFKFCMDREWIEKNPASRLKLPKIGEVERKPYEAAEIQTINEAVEQFPNWGIYGALTRERLRALISVLRWTGMRIGDAIQLSEDKIIDGQLTLRTTKNGKRVSIPVHPEVESALEKIKNGSPYFFWSGNGSVKSQVSCWERTFKKLGTLAKMKVHPHRWRHTFIITLLSRGVPVSEVAAVAGNSPRVIEKHYSHWCQTRADALNAAVKGTW